MSEDAYPHFQFFASNYPYPILFLNRDQLIVWSNSAAKEFLGSNSHEDLADVLFEFRVPGVDVGEVLTCLEESISQQVACDEGKWESVLVDILYRDEGEVDGAVVSLSPRSSNQVFDSVLSDANRLTKRVDEEAHRCIREIVDEAELTMEGCNHESCTHKMEGIIGATRDLTRLCEGAKELLNLLFAGNLGERRPFSLVLAMEDVLVAAEEELAHNRVTVSFDIDEKLPRGLIGNERQFKLMLNHLICGFSRKAERQSFSCRVRWDLDASIGRPALRIELKVSNRLSDEENDDLKLVSVVDDADVEDLDVETLLFGRLVEQMNGAFYRSLREGVNTRCVLEIGLDPALEGVVQKSRRVSVSPSEESSVGAVSSVDFVGLRCMVVDDNRISLEMAFKLLSKLGCRRVEVAGSGASALDLYEKEEFDFVFLDLQMPEMDGYELAERLRSESADRSPLHLVAISAGAWSEVSSECQRAGIEEHLQKPITRKDLQLIIEQSMRVDRKKMSETVGDAENSLGDSDSEQVPILNLDDWSEDEDLHRRMLLMLLDDAPLALEQIQETWKSSDYEGCGRSVHSFKGSVDVVRADRVMNLCQSLLDSLRDENLEKAAILVIELPKAYAEFVAFLERTNYLKAEPRIRHN